MQIMRLEMAGLKIMALDGDETQITDLKIMSLDGDETQTTGLKIMTLDGDETQITYLKIIRLDILPRTPRPRLWHRSRLCLGLRHRRRAGWKAP